MAAALRFAAKRVFGTALARPPPPPQAFLTAAAPTTFHGGSWFGWPFSFSRSAATPLISDKATGASSTVRARIEGALAGLTFGFLLLSPVYVDMIKQVNKRRAAEREHRDWLRRNARYE